LNIIFKQNLCQMYIEFNPKSSDMTIVIPRSCTFQIY